ncbi:Calmodulin-dependent protein kinase cmk2 [Coemansia sp. RSA 2523]|nr:Calmodulin-dependent protein kinase cmk2 [Coemansia sp. RSA 1591]KAJ1755502.1 Calmodulin-dependent protein kinase cmk2 [Coemansia sp. RSA 1752]KAJ1774561.1 Calmodulin-dependent protein kinase cmk2 [Coemansia sp. RSA 1824]KAJ1782711.1 Calmodulin-dependent protein kinase cmk2 [Coemansia sp. RSA 1938]KAJ1804977.1 Calmodulin-dependent protein kinase cmk2 [Coemansia sp. RSA 2523]KAJ2140890.1 Calmodulin-dependent protein kinase cmk2 [Coemansia sp. RSA 564]KAJ2158733.1 Calmodulin-dependent protei
MASAIRGMWHHLSQQPESYERKHYYTFGRVLGAGTFGEVREAVFNPDGRRVAIKVIKKTALSTDEQMVLKEIDIVRHLHHPNIVKLLDWFESKDKYYLVFQLCTGGELFQKICDYGHFTEEDAAKLIRCGFESIAYLHSHNVVHRDIKPENFIFLDSSEDAPLMLADFGIARIMRSEDEILNTMCGSFGYAAPEILLRQGHGKPVDIWSLGVVTFSSLCGYSPFWRFEDPRSLMIAMQSDNVEFVERFWWGISEYAKDFIRRCLRANPNERMTAEQALQHPWLSGEHTATRDLLPDVIENFNARATLRRAVLKIQAVNRMRKLSLNHGSDSSGSEHNSFDSDKDHPSYESNEKEPADEKPKESLPGGWTG